MDLDDEILHEAHRALELLGSKDRPLREGVHDALERAGANHFILATIGSWGDTLPDQDVLDTLRELNDGRFGWKSIASTRTAH